MSREKPVARRIAAALALMVALAASLWVPFEVDDYRVAITPVRRPIGWDLLFTAPRSGIPTNPVHVDLGRWLPQVAAASVVCYVLLRISRKT